MKPVWMFCWVAIGLLTLSGCRFTFSDGYSFDYSGVQTKKSISNGLPNSLKQIQLENKFGDVNVTSDPSKPMEWSWDATVWADDEAIAEVFLSEFQMAETLEGEKLLLTVVLPESNNALNGLKSNLSLNIPNGIELTSRNSHGQTSVSDLTGKSDVNNRHGNAFIQNVAEIKLECAHGDITLDNALGNADITSSHGDVVANNLSGLVANGRHSDFRIKRLNGVGIVETTHGDIQIGQVVGNLQMENSHGDIIVDQIVGDVVADTSFGDMRVNGNSRLLELKNQHGSIIATLDNPDIKAILLKTSHDNIKLTLPADSNVSIQGDGAEFAGDFRSDQNAAVVNIDVSHGDVRVEAKK